MKSVFSYTDYRRYLLDLLKHEKSQSKSASQGEFARRLGLTASHFKMISDGSRNLSVDHVHRIAAKLRLDFSEEQFLETLVLAKHAESPASSRYYRKRIEELRGTRRIDGSGRTLTRRIDTAQASLLSRWDTPALYLYCSETLGLSSGSPSQEQYEILRRKFGLASNEVDRLLASFRSAGLPETVKGPETHVRFNRVSRTNVQKRYLKETFGEAVRRIDLEFEKTTSAFHSHTLTIDGERIPELIDEYKAMLERYIAAPRGGEPAGRPIIQSCFSLFTVA